MTPDRFESMPDTVGIKHEDDCHLHKAVVSLLRRQHAAYVRMVTRIAKRYETSDEGDPEHQCAASCLRDDLLDALTRYAKGKGTP